MLAILRERRKQVLAATFGFAALMMSLSCTSAVQAGILLPQQVDFTADDLEQSLSANASAGAGSPSGDTDSQRSPSGGNKKQRDLLGLQQANLPAGGTSSSGGTSTSSSSGGGISAGTIGWSANSTIAIRDDSPLGRLVEDRGLSLPDPPGTDLLRPPRV